MDYISRFLERVLVCHGGDIAQVILPKGLEESVLNV
jgi:hypothetical protein